MPSYDALHRRIARLAGAGELLRAGLKGVEKESLRSRPNGRLAATPHPAALGSALTHPWLTTDYSEALLEFVTPPFGHRAEVVGDLADLHRFVARNIGDEMIWAASMPCDIASDSDIPIARYGSSNSGRLRHVYRVGLGHRYGRMMQVIAGVHFNYSLPPGFWPVLAESGAAHGEHRTWHGTGRALADSHYFGLIRNLFRNGWLLLYLFGATPALARSFLPDGAPGLESLGADTWHAPLGTSLRMSDIGYTNRIPGGIGIRYDDLYRYAASLHRAITTPHPPWEALGVRDGDEYRQLNANLLQMENEFYSSVRPKQPTRRGERPTEALQRRGVRYVELRSIDLDPESPIGLTEERLAFLEVFMLFCLLGDSPPLAPAERRAIDENQKRVAVAGRDPDATLLRDGDEVPLRGWAREILEEMGAVAELARIPGDDPAAAIRAAGDPVEHPGATPSARVLEAIEAHGGSHLEYALDVSRRHTEALRNEPLAEPEQTRFEMEARSSIARPAGPRVRGPDKLRGVPGRLLCVTVPRGGRTARRSAGACKLVP